LEFEKAEWKGKAKVAEKVVQSVQQRAGSWDLRTVEKKAPGWAGKLVEQMADPWVAYWVV
jgi:hypothetical protein